MQLVEVSISLLALLLAVLQTLAENPPVRTSLSLKRSSNRAVLASKLDPDFWPARGRRSDIKYLKYIPLTPHHVVPWAQVDPTGATTRGLNSDEEGPFWANRGRSLDDDDDEVFWAGRGRSVDDVNYGTYIPLKSNDGDEEPFWANRGRSLQDSESSRVRSSSSGEEDPFWANRGRRQELGGEGDVEEKWKKHRLYVEEPGWVWLNRRESQLPFEVTFSGAGGRAGGDTYDPFWVARGKRPNSKQKRDTSCYSSDSCWQYKPNNTKRFNSDFIRELSNKDDFWPMRGKRLLWRARGRRTDQLSRALEMAKEDHFWPARGKKSVNTQEAQTTDRTSL